MGGSRYMRISELRMKDVIAAEDGRRLGYINDMDIDPDAGRIEALIIPGKRSWRWMFGRTDEIVLPWQRIVKLGIDVIIVQKEIVAVKNAAPEEKRRVWDEEFDFFDA